MIPIQGSKRRLAEIIAEYRPETELYIEPFCGGLNTMFYAPLNSLPKNAIFIDNNVHLISLFQCGKAGGLHIDRIQKYLKNLSELPEDKIRDGYYKIREVGYYAPHEYAFLVLMSINSIVRHNKSGFFNAPIGDKKLTKERIDEFTDRLRWLYAMSGEWEFICNDFLSSSIFSPLLKVSDAFFYVDPPYSSTGNVQYFTAWRKEHDRCLFEMLREAKSKVMISSWLSKGDEQNLLIDAWADEGWSIVPIEHSYTVSPTAGGRGQLEECLIMNY